MQNRPQDGLHGDREQYASYHRPEERILRLSLVTLHDLLLCLGRAPSTEHTAQTGTDDDTDQWKLANTGVPAALLLEHVGINGEEHGEEAVDDADVCNPVVSMDPCVYLISAYI